MSNGQQGRLASRLQVVAAGSAASLEAVFVDARAHSCSRPRRARRGLKAGELGCARGKVCGKEVAARGARVV